MIKRYVYYSVFMVGLLMLLPLVVLMTVTNIGALASTAIGLFDSPKVTSDQYDYGECTYWVALRRLQIGEPIPNTWGNAITWAARAIQDGYLVNKTPSFGAIMQNPYAYGGLGHVAFVEKVNPINGDWTVSEMNRVGWDEIDQRTFSPGAAIKYNFIHQIANGTIIQP